MVAASRGVLVVVVVVVVVVVASAAALSCSNSFVLNRMVSFTARRRARFEHGFNMRFPTGLFQGMNRVHSGICSRKAPLGQADKVIVHVVVSGVTFDRYNMQYKTTSYVASCRLVSCDNDNERRGKITAY